MPQEVVFSRITGIKRKSSHVADQILEAVRAGVLQDGDKLPSERELAEQIGVSRNCIREAMSALSIAGLIRTRVGEGSYISHAARAKVDQGVHSLLESGIDMLDIWRAKEEIEVLLLLSSIELLEETDLDEIQDVIDNMQEAVERREYARFSVTNIQFHKRISEVSDNEALRRAEEFLLRLSQQLYRIADRGASDEVAAHLDRSLQTHIDILDVLKRRDHRAVPAVMKRHFREVESFLLSAFNRPLDSATLSS